MDSGTFSNSYLIKPSGYVKLIPKIIIDIIQKHKLEKKWVVLMRSTILEHSPQA